MIHTDSRLCSLIDEQILESRLFKIKHNTMKTLIYRLFLASTLFLTSCHGDPYYSDTFHIRNSTNHNVKCYIEAEPEYMIGIFKYPEVELTNNEKEPFFNLKYDVPRSCFDNDYKHIINIDNIDTEIEITFTFDDTLSICYKKEDFYENNPCLTKNWEIISDIDKKRNKQHESVYVITENNYIDALEN